MSNAVNLSRLGRADPGAGFAKSFSFTANQVLTRDHAGGLIDNSDATAALEHTLPADAEIGDTFVFIRDADYDVGIKPPGADYFKGYDPAEAIVLICEGQIVAVTLWKAGRWIVLHDTGVME